MPHNLLFLDTETTGRGEEDRLCQIAYKLQGKPGVSQLFNPPVPISFEAMAVHHITNDDVYHEPKFDGSPMKTHLQALLKDNVLVAHNAPFDIAMLEREGLKVGEFIDTLKVVQFVCDLPSYKLQFLRYQFGVIVPEAKAHDAEGDVMILEGVFNWIAAIMSVGAKEEMPEVFKDMIRISGMPTLMRRMPFGKHKGELLSDIPKDYFNWLLKQDLDDDLRYNVANQIKPQGLEF